MASIVKKFFNIFYKSLKKYFNIFLLALFIFFFIFSIVISYYFQNLQFSNAALIKNFSLLEKKYHELKNQDQIKINQENQIHIKNIKEGYSESIKLYEQILDIKAQKQETVELDKLYVQSIKYLSEFNFASGNAELKNLSLSINKVNAKLNQSLGPAQNATASNTAPNSGFSYQNVSTSLGTFTVAIIAADLNSTRVIIDTASDSDCSNNCPVMSLGDYVSRSGAFAGINGSFFCPAEYPTCQGKTNSFDTLMMNKNKHYFNSDNNKYSTVPLVYFSGNTMGVRGQSLEWGRTTDVDAVIANHPLYIIGGNNVFSGSSDPKINSQGSRTFVGNKGSMVYIGIVYNSSASEAANVLKTLGLENALGLDQGGSTALWYNGYKAGPGRGIPSALLFVRK